MAEDTKNNSSFGLTYSEPGHAASEFSWTEDDEESLRVVKLGGAVAIFTLLAYLAHDQHLRGENAPEIGWHWVTLGATCLFFALLWTQWFRRRWKSWVLMYSLFVIGMFILISRVTGDPESRFIAIMLCTLATAAFVSWGTRWQFAMGVTALLGYAAGEYLVPIETPFRMYRWMGLIAGVILVNTRRYSSADSAAASRNRCRSWRKPGGFSIHKSRRWPMTFAVRSPR